MGMGDCKCLDLILSPTGGLEGPCTRCQKAWSIMRLAIIDAHPLAQTWLSGENSRHECLSQDLAVPCRIAFVIVCLAPRMRESSK